MSNCKRFPLLRQINSKMSGYWLLSSHFQNTKTEEEKRKSNGMVEIGKAQSSVEGSEWRKHSHARCGHSAGTKCGHRDANCWTAAKDLSPCCAFSPSFCPRRNNKWEYTASHLHPATPQTPPPSNFTLIQSFRLTFSLWQVKWWLYEGRSLKPVSKGWRSTP